MASCNGCQFIGACYKLRPSNASSDGLFYCIACWSDFGGLPLEYVESSPTSCRSCSTSYGVLWMMNPGNALSTGTFHCTECWRLHGGVPAKAVGFPWPAGAAVSGPPRSVLSNVKVTDFGWPEEKMVQPHTVCMQRQAILKHYGATCHNFVDATNGTAVLEQLGIDGIDVAVWGSPHWRTFNTLFPDLDPTRFETNGDYKAIIVPELMKQYPGAAIVVPHPAYYMLEGAVPVTLPCVDGVQYTPMVSMDDCLMRLCKPNQVMATYHGDFVDASIINGTLWLRNLIKRAIMERKRVVFFGEYICDLSYVCCMESDDINY